MKNGNLITFVLILWFFSGSGNASWPRLIVVSVVMFAMFLFALYWYQEKLLYQPKIYPQFATPSQNPPSYRSPAEHGMQFEDVYITTPDGNRLHAWFIKQDTPEETKSRPTLLFFHANAGNMGFRLPNLKKLHEIVGVNILILSYRGYGESTGSPTEEGLMMDCEATYQHLRGRTDIDQNRVLIFGRSLGGACAVSVCARHNDQIRGLILENTFTCISDMVDQLFPILKFFKRWILRMHWPSIRRIALISHPILFISGLRDEVVPADQMERLFQAAVGSRDRRMKIVPTGQHNDTWAEGGVEYFNEFKRFVDSCCE